MRLTRTFDRRSQRLADQVTAFQAEVAELEKAVAPAMVVTHVRREGHLLHVTVMSAMRAEAAARIEVPSSVEPFKEAWW